MVVLLVLATLFCLLPGLATAQSSASERWLREVDDPKRVGLQMLEEGDLVGAKELLERAELADPTDPQVLRGLAKTYYGIGILNLEAGNNVEAGYYFERALVKDANLPEGYLGLGRAAYASGDYDPAIEALTRAEQLGSREAGVWLVRARTKRADKRIDLGELTAAEQDVQDALRRAPTDPEAQLVLGRLEVVRERPEAALAPLAAAAATPEFYAPATVLLSQAQQQRGAWAESIRAASDVAEIAGYRARADELRAGSYYRWGLADYNAGRWARAEAHFFAAAEFAPDWDDPRFSGALAQLQQDRGEDAKVHLEALYRRRPDYPGVRTALAVAEAQIGRHLAAAGNLDAAVPHLVRSFELDPSKPDVQLLLADVERRRGRFEAALDAYAVALRSGGDPVRAHRGLLTVLDDDFKRPLEALPHAEAILALQADDTDARARLIRITREQGFAAADRGDDLLASTLLDRHREFVADDVVVNYRLAQVRLKLLDFAGADALAAPLLAAFPQDARYADLVRQAQIGLGDEATYQYRWDAARDAYARALALDPAQPHIRLRYGRALLQLDAFADAVEALRQVWREAPGLHARVARPLAAALTGRADELLATDAAAARALAAEAIARDPEYAFAYRSRSEAYERLGDLDNAILDAEAFYSRRPDDLDGEVWLVDLYRRGMREAFDAERYEIAEARARKLLDMRKDDYDGVYWLARALYAQARFPEAEPWLEKAAAAGPYRAAAYVWLARGYRAGGNPERAAKYFLTARGLDPTAATRDEQVSTLKEAAGAAQVGERYDDVATYFKYAFLLAPDDPEVAYGLGAALMRIAKHAEAEPHLRRAHAAWPERRDVALDYGETLVIVGKPLDAVRVYAPWEVDGKPDAAEVRRRVGEAYLAAAGRGFDARDYGSAVGWAQEAAERLPASAEAHYLLGRMRFELSQPDEALVAFNHVLTLDPQYRDVRVYLARLHAARGHAALALDDVTTAAEEFSLALNYARNEDALFGQALLAERAGDAVRVLELLDDLATTRADYPGLTPVRVRAHRALGESMLEAKQWQAARQHFQRMLALDGNANEAHYLIGIAALGQNEPAEAIKHLSSAMAALGSDYRDVRIHLIEAHEREAARLVNAGEARSARRVIAASLAIEPDQPRLFVLLGALEAADKDYADAAAQYRRALASPKIDAATRSDAERRLAELPLGS